MRKILLLIAPFIVAACANSPDSGQIDNEFSKIEYRKIADFDTLKSKYNLSVYDMGKDDIERIKEDNTTIYLSERITNPEGGDVYIVSFEKRWFCGSSGCRKRFFIKKGDGYEMADIQLISHRNHYKRVCNQELSLVMHGFHRGIDSYNIWPYEQRNFSHSKTVDSLAEAKKCPGGNEN